MTVHAEKPGCKVDLDGAPQGETDPQGDLILTDVDPSDHYVHVDCPGQTEITRFVSPGAGENAELRVVPRSAAGEEGGDASSIASAEHNLELRKLLGEAMDLRAGGQFPQAIQKLRQAVQVDPDNPDLHRELGITFLMIRDWGRARIELLEAIHHDAGNADAHNGLGYALEKLGEIRPALDQFRIATHLDPNDESYQQHYLEALGMLAAQQYEKKNKKR